MSLPTTMLSRQVRTATGSFRGQVGRAAKNNSRRSQARFASSSSSSSSSVSQSTRNNLYYAAPFVVIAGVAAYSIFGHSNQEPHAIDPSKRKEYWQRMAVEERKQQQAKKEEKEESPSNDEKEESPVSGNEEVVSIATSDLEEEASQESAFDPETNTINWDCPCLGGMAHGPCGEEFKTAFSCFVFSEAEPKGIDCVENFKAMQDCFRKHPEHYKDEIEDDDEFENQERSAGGDMAPADSLSTSDDSQRRGEEDEDEGVREFRREMSKES